MLVYSAKDGVDHVIITATLTPIDFLLACLLDPEDYDDQGTDRTSKDGHL